MEQRLIPLFLDVDGVLNRWDDEPLSIRPDCADRLDRIVAACAPLYVVLSSSWRRDDDLYRMVRERFVIYDRTRTLASGGPRGDEIDEWLTRHPEFRPGIILDDEPDFHPYQQLVQADGKVGVTRANEQQVIHLVAEDRREIAQG